MNNFDDDSDGCRYYGGGCFAGSKILMADGSLSQVSDLNKGDKIATPSGPAAIKCNVKTLTFQGMADMCHLPNGLLITPGHPIKLQNNWIYPRDLKQRQSIQCEAFYNLVVSNDHRAIINGTQVILLGHNYTQGILNHAYYGSNKVIEDLEKMPGFANGLVVIQQGPQAMNA
jgi:hypothetical protein